MVNTQQKQKAAENDNLESQKTKIIYVICYLYVLVKLQRQLFMKGEILFNRQFKIYLEIKNWKKEWYSEN